MSWASAYDHTRSAPKRIFVTDTHWASRALIRAALQQPRLRAMRAVGEYCHGGAAEVMLRTQALEQLTRADQCNAKQGMNAQHHHPALCASQEQLDERHDGHAGSHAGDLDGLVVTSHSGAAVVDV